MCLALILISLHVHVRTAHFHGLVYSRNIYFNESHIFWYMNLSKNKWLNHLSICCRAPSQIGLLCLANKLEMSCLFPRRHKVAMTCTKDTNEKFIEAFESLQGCRSRYNIIYLNWKLGQGRRWEGRILSQLVTPSNFPWCTHCTYTFYIPAIISSFH